MTKFTELPSISSSTISNNDVIPIVDVSLGTSGSSKVDISNLSLKINEKNLYTVTSIAEAEALDPTVYPMFRLVNGANDGIFKWVTYNATADYALDGVGCYLLRSSLPTSSGAFLRQDIGKYIQSTWTGAVADVDESNAAANGTRADIKLNIGLYWASRLRKKFLLMAGSGSGFRLDAPLLNKAYVDIEGNSERFSTLFPVGAIPAIAYGSAAYSGAEDLYHQVLDKVGFNGKYTTGDGNAIRIAGSSGVTQKFGEFKRLYIYNFNTSRFAFDLIGNAYQIEIKSNHFLLNANHLSCKDDGVSAPNTAFPVGISVIDNVFEQAGNNSSAALLFRNCSSIAIKRNKIQSNQTLYTILKYADTNKGTFLSSEIEDNYFENNTKVSGGSFKAGGIEIYITGTSRYITGINIVNNKFHTSALNCMWFENTYGCTVKGNTGGDPATCPLRTTGFQGDGNFYDTALMSGSPVMGTGSSLRYLTGSANFDPPSLNTAASTTTTVTVTGAAVGDYVEYTNHSASIDGITISGSVTSANTVTVTFTNSWAANPTDLPNGTVLVRVRKS